MDINGYSYEGSIELVRSNNAWLAVNEVSLENYVASVVGAEMPSRWHGEALKAQAVAARSYAVTHLVRPASKTYHLGDTTRWQVFSGHRA
jgi:SpoIID/LytB domain protein